MSDYSTLLMRVYGDLANPLPATNSLAEAMPFSKADKIGDRYEFAVRMSTSQGFTYNSDHTGFAINDSVSAVYQTAYLSGSETLGQEAVSYGDLSRLSDSKGKSKGAYDSAISRLILDLTEGAENHREANILYGAGTAGAVNLGVASAVVTAASGGVITINISQATFAPGMWQVLNNVKLTAYNAAGTPLNKVVKVTGMDVSRCRLTLTEVTSGAAADIGTKIGLGEMPAFFFNGARTTSMIGLQGIVENTGTLNGISAATYPQWKSHTKAVGGALSFDKIQEGVAQVSDTGLEDGLDLWMGSRAWTDLANDEAAFRRYVEQTGGKDANVGFAKLTFVSSCGKLNLRSHRFMKQGIAIGTPTKKCRRIGSRDISFELPGNPNKFFWLESSTNAQSSIRCYADQAVLVESPNFAIEFTGITSAGDAVPA
jgi:hypothetical protein